MDEYSSSIKLRLKGFVVEEDILRKNKKMDDILEPYVQQLEKRFIEVKKKEDGIYEFEYQDLDCFMTVYQDTIQIQSLMTAVCDISDWKELYIYELANRINVVSEFTKIVIVDSRLYAITRFFIQTNTNPYFHYELSSYLERKKRTIDLFNQNLGEELR